MRKRAQRYEARPNSWKFLGVTTGGVWDNEINTWAREEELRYVTTYSHAKRLAKRANKTLRRNHDRNDAVR